MSGETGVQYAEGRKANRLLGERSPYLRQHAYNPVDWYPWGEEALLRAKEEDKPIFLSIGYSSCHWCHVMEEESFQDEEVAHLLNDAFICIKVDREERPDLDNTYMTAAQVLSGGGGWPLTLFLTPDKKPFFAATYIPKEPSRGILGLMTLLPTLADFWKNRRTEIEATSDKVIVAIKESGEDTAGGSLGEETMIDAFQRLMENFDESYGGFGTAPKFPTPHRLTFLLRYWYRTGDSKGLWMVDRTLEEMRKRGIFDQLGKGFHRYSTDQQWLLPHFEKMLYDQALLAIAYIEAWQATGKKIHASTAREILDFVMGRMTSTEGGFFSAEDADSEGKEGKFYYWKAVEISKVLEPDEIELARRYMGVTKEGNVVEGISGNKPGRNVLRLTSLEALEDPRFENIRQKLVEARDKRVRPAIDDKIMVDWNGLMIAALARAGVALSDRRYVEAAIRAADLVLDNMRDEKGALPHVLRKGGAAIPGFLDDYAFFAWGLLELYQADLDPRWLETAMTIVKGMTDNFWDPVNGGFFQTAEGAHDVIQRRKELFDGAVPSGNSIALLDLLVLHRITEEQDLKKKAERTITAFSGAIFRSPENFTQFLNAIDYTIGPSYSVVLAGLRGSEDIARFHEQLAPRFIPNKVVLLIEPGPSGDVLRKISPLVTRQGMKDGRAVAFVCTEKACLPETADPQKFIELFRKD